MRDDHCFHQLLSTSTFRLGWMQWNWSEICADSHPKTSLELSLKFVVLVIDDTLWFVSLQLRLMCCLTGGYGL